MYPAPEPVPISDVELEEQNKRLIQRSRHNLRRCWVHEHHLWLKHFFVFQLICNTFLKANV